MALDSEREEERWTDPDRHGDAGWEFRNLLGRWLAERDGLRAERLLLIAQGEEVKNRLKALPEREAALFAQLLGWQDRLRAWAEAATMDLPPSPGETGSEDDVDSADAAREGSPE